MTYLEYVKVYSLLCAIIIFYIYGIVHYSTIEKNHSTLSILNEPYLFSKLVQYDKMEKTIMDPIQDCSPNIFWNEGSR